MVEGSRFVSLIKERTMTRKNGFASAVKAAATKARVQLYVDAGELGTIDTAAEEAGENRSEFMMKAALARAAEGESAFTQPQLLAIENEVLKVITNFSKTQARDKLAQRGILAWAPKD